MTAAPHVPVLRQKSIDLLRPESGKRIVDGTFGFGGHSRMMLAAGAEVLGLDLDEDAIAAGTALAAAEPNFRCLRISFREMRQVLAESGWGRADGILLDLGVSSLQIDDPGKGFTYREDGPLDLRFDTRSGGSAADLIARLEAEGLADILHELGEERAARRIARSVVRAREERPLETTQALRDAVAAAVGGGPKLNATLSRVFQALRIAVNDELGALRDVLAAVPDCLSPGGRIVVISYHSLEDRTVKQWLARESRDCLCPPEIPVCRCGHRRTMQMLTRRPMAAEPAEISENPRARSARLRAGERIA